MQIAQNLDVIEKSDLRFGFNAPNYPQPVLKVHTRKKKKILLTSVIAYNCYYSVTIDLQEVVLFYLLSSNNCTGSHFFDITLLSGFFGLVSPSNHFRVRSSICRPVYNSKL